ncbi:hypothetical protein L209DRAFT_679230 [Thermothelomyces heterothallicus CBS 203.75]
MAVEQTTRHQDAPPAYSEVTGQQSSRGFRSEKGPSKRFSEDGPSSTPAGTRRPTVWRRIWNRLALPRCLRQVSSEPPVSPLLSRELENARPLPRSHLPLVGSVSQYSDDGWRRPVTTCSVQTGRLPSRGRWRYKLACQHCPIERATPEALEAAPWIAEAIVGVQDLRRLVQEPPAWLENLHRCFSDKISTKRHPLLPNKKLFRRRIKIYYRSPDGASVSRAAGISIWHRDAQWLAALTYARMATMFRPETMMCASAHKFSAEDVLDVGKVFYLVFPKSCCTQWWPPCFQGDDRCMFRRIFSTHLYLDDPELRDLAHSYFGPQLPGGRPPPMKMCQPEREDAECAGYDAFFT